MLKASRNIVAIAICLLLASSSAYSQNKGHSVIEEIILAVDSTCTLLSTETHYPWSDDVSMAYYRNIENVLDSDVFIQITKNIPSINNKITFTQDDFKKIQLVTPVQMDSLNKSEDIEYRHSESSQPIFSNNKQYVIIQYSIIDAGGKSGATYLLEKINNKWVAIGGLNSWFYCGR